VTKKNGELETKKEEKERIGNTPFYLIQPTGEKMLKKIASLKVI